MTVYNGPAVTDTVGGTPGTGISAALLNAFLLVQQSYLINSPVGIPSSASAVNPPVILQPALQAVINYGSGIAYINPAATTVTCGSGSTAQDNYVDVDNSGNYHVTTVAAGATPGSPASNTLRLYKATTNGSNNAVTSFTNLANTNPLISSNAMLSDGSNAAALVTLTGNLNVAGTTTVNNDLLLTGVVRSSAATPVVSVTFGVGAGTGPSGLVINGDVNWGSVNFTTGTGPTTGTAFTFSITPGGTRTLMGIMVNGNYNSASSTRFVGQTVVTNTSGTFTVGVTISGTALAASTAHTFSYWLLWA